MTDACAELLDRALAEEATKKSGLVWVRASGPARAVWHVWHEARRSWSAAAPVSSRCRRAWPTGAAPR